MTKSSKIAPALAFLFLATGAAPPVSADDNKSTGVSDQSNKIRIELGSMTGLSRGGKTSTYYKLQFEGNSLFSHGTAPSADDPLVTYGAVKPQDADSNPLSFRLEKREPGTTEGDLNFLASRKLFLPKGLPLQGVLDFSTQTNARQVNVAGGIETTALHPLKFLNHIAPNNQKQPLSVANWAHIGFVGESQTRPASEGGNQDVLGLSYRAFAGTGFGPTNKRRYLLKEIRKFYEKNSAFDYDTLIANLRKAKKLEKGAETYDNLMNKINIQLQILIMTGPTPDTHKDDPIDPANREKVIAQFSQTDLNITDEDRDDEGTKPVYKLEVVLVHKNSDKKKDKLDYNVTSPLRWQLYVESAGRYYMTGHFNTSRWQPLTAVTMKYILNPQKDPDGGWIAVRFQNGREKSSPLVYKNFASASIGMAF